MVSSLVDAVDASDTRCDVDRVDALFRPLETALESLLTAPESITSLSPATVLECVRRFEAHRRTQSTLDHLLLCTLLAGDTTLTTRPGDLAAVLCTQLRITPSDARARVAAAQQLGPQTSTTGAALPPLFPEIAAAQRDGAISAEHARIITDTLTQLSDDADAAHGGAVQTELLAHARTLNPHHLRVAAAEVRDRVDPPTPDRPDVTAARQATRRDLRFTTPANGVPEIHGRITDELLASVQAVLTPLSAPVPGVDGTQDARTPGQRMHDALLDLCTRTLTQGHLPHAAGVPATGCC